MLTDKNIIIMHPSGKGACSFYRMLFVESILRSDTVSGVEPLVSMNEIDDDYILKHTAAIIVQRPTNTRHEILISHYKRKRGKYGFKLFADYDDILFDIDGKNVIPDYNIAQTDCREIGALMERILWNVDGVTVSTAFLKRCMERRFGWNHVSVVPNAIPRFCFGHSRREPVTAAIVRPRVLYGGSVTHFGIDDPGDFAGPWIPWLIRAVKEDRIDLHVFGRPGFLESVADKVSFHKFVSAIEYPSVAASIRPDVYLAPLQENDFNRAKSNLKLIEAASLGAVLLGSTFLNGPYEHAHPYSKVYAGTTIDELDAQLELVCRKDDFNAIIGYQYSLMDDIGYWMENRHYLSRYLKAYLGDFKEFNR